MTYRFYITIGVVQTEVFPLNFLESKLIDEQVQDEIFYRRKFNGSLTFVNVNGGADFDLLNGLRQSDPYTRIVFTIKRAGVNYWEGSFVLTDGHFDLNRQTLEIRHFGSVDAYEEMLKLADDQYDIVDGFKSSILDCTVTATRNGVTTSFTRNHFLYNHLYAGDLTRNILEYLADKIKPGATVSSTFFSAEVNPVTLASSFTRYLTIAQKSDIIRPSSSEQATNGNLSWNDLMNILWAMFQVKWDYVPATDTINVEHISFWSAGAGMDLRTQEISKAESKFTFLKERMPKYEKFQWMEALSENFKGLPITYYSDSVDQNPESNTKEIALNVTTDLEYIMTTPLEIADEGFVILCNELNAGNYSVQKGLGFLAFAPEVKLNMHLSWANLHHYYYRHNRVLPEGILNNEAVTFWSSQKNKQQDCYAIVCPSDNYDPSDEVTTELGETYFNGEKATVLRSELDPHGLMKLSLAYGSPDVEQTPLTESNWIQITETDCGEFSAELSGPADANLSIVIKYIIYNSSLQVVCADTGDGETWTIPIGQSTSTFSLTFCDTIPDGGCIRYVGLPFVVTGHPEWPVGVSFNTCNCKYF